MRYGFLDNLLTLIHSLDLLHLLLDEVVQIRLNLGIQNFLKNIVKLGVWVRRTPLGRVEVKGHRSQML